MLAIPVTPSIDDHLELIRSEPHSCSNDKVAPSATYLFLQAFVAQVSIVNRIDEAEAVDDEHSHRTKLDTSMSGWHLWRFRLGEGFLPWVCACQSVRLVEGSFGT